MAKLNLAVVFGGRTVEHDVSIVTALQFMENANKEKYGTVPLYISRDGRWFTGEKLRDIAFYEKFDAAQVTQVYLEPTDGSRGIYPVKTGAFGGRKPLLDIDCVVPAIHGMNGEDGTLQGLLELMNIPYASPGVLGSAVGMDKIAMKMVFTGAGMPLVPWAAVERSRYVAEGTVVLNELESCPGYPMYVKPSNLGSSIGITRADDREGLQRALEVAFSYDRRAVVEHGLTDVQEINCSALGFEGNVKASLCEQPVSWKEFLTFEEKYLRGGKGAKAAEGAKGGGMESMQRLIPAPISEELTKRVQELTVQAFKLLDCRGVVRVDFMIDKASGALYINEINTVPGSFAFYLWEPAGIPYPKLIDLVIEKAYDAHKEKNKNSYAYDSTLLKKFKKGGAKG